MLLAVALPIGLIAVALVGLLLRIIAFALILPAAGYEADSFVSILIASLIYGAVQTALSGAHRHVGRGLLLGADGGAGHARRHRSGGE